MGTQPKSHLGNDIPRVAGLVDLELAIIFIMFGYIITGRYTIMPHRGINHQPVKQ